MWHVFRLKPLCACMVTRRPAAGSVIDGWERMSAYMFRIVDMMSSSVNSGSLQLVFRTNSCSGGER